MMKLIASGTWCCLLCGVAVRALVVAISGLHGPTKQVSQARMTCSGGGGGQNCASPVGRQGHWQTRCGWAGVLGGSERAQRGSGHLRPVQQAPSLLQRAHVSLADNRCRPNLRSTAPVSQSRPPTASGPGPLTSPWHRRGGGVGGGGGGGCCSDGLEPFQCPPPDIPPAVTLHAPRNIASHVVLCNRPLAAGPGL